MLIYGSGVNKKKLIHEFYTEKIAAEKLRIQEEQAKAAQKAANEAKVAAMRWGNSSEPWSLIWEIFVLVSFALNYFHKIR